MADSLGRLEQITDLRLVWEREDAGFTPWLAKPENLKLLGDTIGIDLEFEATEKEVGPFRADILCKDTTSNSWVLIENQLEPTDHGHLGQLLTYAPKLQAVTIVWIAQRFREEHRAALDWLNKITDDSIQFFGLEVELWRIGSSQIAPKFNMVCKPNDWSKTLSSQNGITGGEGLSDLNRLQLEYWSEFKAYLESKKSFLKGTKAQPQQWLTFSIGRTSFGMYAVVNTRYNRIEAQVGMTGSHAKAYFGMLEADKAAIEVEFDEALLWEELPTKKESLVAIHLNDGDPINRPDWPRQHEWLRVELEKLHRVFSPRIRQLTVEPMTSGTDAEAAPNQNALND